MKHFVICTKSSNWTFAKFGKKVIDVHRPIKGEIYCVKSVIEFEGEHYYSLEHFGDAYNTKSFRDCDNTFGHVVTETIEKQQTLAACSH
jgi:hypothetical protein